MTKSDFIHKAVIDGTPVAIKATAGFHVGVPERIEGSVVLLRRHGFLSAVSLRKVKSVRHWDEPAEEVVATANEAADMLRARVGLGPVAE